MRCNRELLSRYKDGEVTPQERRDVETHLTSCPDCAATLAAYQNMGRAISSLSKLRTPASLRAELFERIAQQNGRSSGGSLFGSFLSGLALAGTAVALILILSVFFSSMNNRASVVQATAVYPPPDASDISPASTIEVQFNRPMDTKSVETSVAITPSVDATMDWQGEKLVVKPVPSLAANTSYTVTIGDKAKDVQGTPVKETVVLRFSTGAIDVPTRTATATSTVATTPVASPSPTTPGPATPTPTATPSPTATPAPLTPWPRLVVIDPTSPSTIFLAMSSGALYKSANGGASWHAVGSGLPVGVYALNNLIVDPQVSQILYAGTSQGAYRSSDSGESWYPINNGLPAVASNAKPNVQTLVMHPLNRLVLYAGLPTGTTPATVYRSTDAGASWSPLSSINPDGAAKPVGPDSLVFYPDAPGTLFAGTANGMFLSADAGAHWIPANKNLAEPIISLVINPKDRSVLYAATQNGIYKTARGSVDWQKLNLNSTSTSMRIRALNIAPDDTLYVSTTWSEPAGRRSTAIRSTDGGNSWSPIQGSLENTEPQAFAFDPSNPRTVYAPTLAGIFKSADGGNRWTQLNFVALPTPTRQPEITVSGVISEISSSSLAIRVLSDDRETWLIAVNQDPLQSTQIAFGDGRPALFADLRLLSRLTATGKASAEPRPQAEKILVAYSITILADKLTPTATPAPTPPYTTTTARIGYVYDSMLGSVYTGDWPTHLRSRGHLVTPLDIRNESGFDPEGYDLVIISWLSGQFPAANVAKLQNVKAPILNAYSPLVDKLGQGKIYDQGNPGRTLYGKTITIEEGGGALTWGYSGEVTAANDTLYRVPIIASGAVLATVTDEQQGVRSAPVWAFSDKKIYFGFWYSKDGTNHNEAYWTFFDRSVDYLLGRLQIPSPVPTPRVVDK